MAYEESLAQNVRRVLAKQKGLTEREMFGGIGFMVRGNLCCGVLQNELIVRVGPDRYAEAAKRPHTRLFDFTGRPMKGWLVVKAQGCASKKTLQSWIRQGLNFALSLPPK